MDVKKKLMELIDIGSGCPDGMNPFGDSCESCRYYESAACHLERLADYLIANGVRLDSNQAAELPRDFGRWIPVEERKPDTVFCEATGKRYSEAVNVLTSGRKVITAIYDGEDFVGDAEFWWVEDGEVITHWTPVLLPLPQTPKGE